MAMTGIWGCAQLPNSPPTAEATLAVTIIIAPVRPVLPPAAAAKPQHKAANIQYRLMTRASGREVAGIILSRPSTVAICKSGWWLRPAYHRPLPEYQERIRQNAALESRRCRVQGVWFSRMSGKVRRQGSSMQSPMPEPEPRPAGCATFAMYHLGHFSSLLPEEGPAFAVRNGLARILPLRQ